MQSEHRSVERPRRLSKTAIQILAYVGRHEGEPCTKAQIADALGRNVKTVDRLVSKMKGEGLLLVEPRWGDNGGQVANSYRLARTGEGDGMGR